MSQRDDTGKKVMVGALVAAATGYLVGLLTAPKSGKQTRADIANKADDLKDDAQAQLHKLQDEGDELFTKAKEKGKDASQKAKAELDDAVTTMKSAQQKASTILKAVKAGEADNNELNKALKQARQARDNLLKFLKS